ncbi:hypothetical protein B0H13DRAFT_2538142 [Mycena leptocephala]|nr:hypothetical protein B0H13DRAFT_2538142 [Mycena leptocephala]
MPGNKCTLCFEANLDCAYLPIPVNRRPVPPQSYVHSLEVQLDQSEALVRQLRTELAYGHFANSSSYFFTQSVAPPTDTMDAAWGAPQPPPHPDDLGHLEIPRKLDNVSLGIVKDRGFIGKSSEISLVNAAINLKVDLKREQHSHCQSPEQSADDHVEVDSAVPAWPSWRLEYWRWKSWATVERRTALFYAPKYIPPVAASANVRAWSRGRPAFELAVTFLAGSSSPQACRMLVGIGLRLEQTAGIHQRTARIEVPSVERELLKRAFWVLVWLDCSISSGLRHPYALQYDDFDVELPLECDDEFWEHPIHPFQQPPGLPSRIASFNMMIRHYIVQSQDTGSFYSPFAQ